MEGDRAHGCITLPIRFGVRRAAWMIAPFFVLPWLLIPLFAWLPGRGGGPPLLTGNRVLLTALGIGLALWGVFAALLVRDPDELARTENHPAWTHMYLLMMAAQVGFALSPTSLSARRWACVMIRRMFLAVTMEGHGKARDGGGPSAAPRRTGVSGSLERPLSDLR